MPYEIKQNGENYDVVNTETHEVVATHEPPDAKEHAEAQVRILHDIEKDDRWDKED